jgi:hypothetical protein
MAELPTGTIIAYWAKGGPFPPPGWALCDGQGGTPDLRGKFVRGGAALGEISDAAGLGAETHTHPFAGKVERAPNSQAVSGFVPTTGISRLATDSHQHTFKGDTASASSLPPYAVLVYLMKL